MVGRRQATERLEHEPSIPPAIARAAHVARINPAFGRVRWVRAQRHRWDRNVCRVLAATTYAGIRDRGRSGWDRSGAGRAGSRLDRLPHLPPHVCVGPARLRHERPPGRRMAWPRRSRLRPPYLPAPHGTPGWVLRRWSRSRPWHFQSRGWPETGQWRGDRTARNTLERTSRGRRRKSPVTRERPPARKQPEPLRLTRNEGVGGRVPGRGRVTVWVITLGRHVTSGSARPWATSTPPPCCCLSRSVARRRDLQGARRSGRRAPPGRGAADRVRRGLRALRGHARGLLVRGAPRR